MKMLKAILIIGIILCASPALTAEYNVFGPIRYDGSTGKAITQTDTFSSSAAGSNFTLRLQNGDGQGHNLVTSTTVTLNGIQVITPSDVKSGTPLIERQVNLNLSNTLTVTVNSKTGSYLTITIIGQNSLVTIPNVVGMTQTNAQAAITAANLVVGTATTASSSTVTAGSVISQNPAAGTTAAQGSAVNLVISSGPAANVTVPNVVGMTQTNAQASITAANLVLGTVTTAASSTVPAGSVISQNPASGTTVAQSSAVNLVVSSGPAFVSVPNVVDMTQTNAQATITTANLLVGTMTNATSNKVPAGSVISQNPVSGTLVLPGTAVNLVISLGRNPVTVPYVVGMSQASAQTTITSATLVVGNVTSAYSDTVPTGNVISQNPVSGTLVVSGSAVNLIVSSGPAPVTVPNVLGMTQANAQAVIVATKLVIGNVTSSNSITVPAGSVISQNPTVGTVVSQGSAVDLVISSGPASVSVPNVLGMTQTNAQAAIAATNLLMGGVTTAFSNTVAAGNVISQKPAANKVVLEGTSVALVISSGTAQLVIPPDPSTIAPPIDKTIAPSMAVNTAFLFSGSNPIQTGVAPGTIQIKQAAVLRGQVYGKDGNSLPGVAVTIQNHQEFGQTVTRTDGMFDMAVNGGGPLTVSYMMPGYMTVHRQMNVPWNDFALLPDVVMLPLDTQVTTINLTSSAPIQVARGSASIDGDGARQATMLFAQGTNAQLKFPDGSSRPITGLNVRATEYTVGPNGPKAMPANLPPTSAYTYAVELSADEALAAGATGVSFDRPVYCYVENFLNFPVGGVVPAGYYDYVKAAWIPSDNGRVIKVLTIAGGYADIDTDGSGLPADFTRLAALGITDAERQQLAALYIPGQSLWRVPVTHFTPWDFNWPFAPPMDAVSPDVPAPDQENPIEDPDCKGGSIIECQNRTLGESLPIPGTSFSLNYRSDRVPGRKSGQTLSISLSGATVPASLAGIVLEIEVAGRKITQNFPPSPNQTYEFVWDGVDIYGRKSSGRQRVYVNIGYSYNYVRYSSPDEFADAFARFGMSPYGTIPTRESTITTWQNSTGTVRYPDAAPQGIGAWSIDVHHVYDSFSKKLYQGDGATRTVESSDLGIVSTFAGTGACCLDYNKLPIPGDGGPAMSGNFFGPTNLKFGPDGSLFIADQYFIRKISSDGIITTVAGAGMSSSISGDGGPATSAVLSTSNGIRDVAVASDGSFYVLDRYTGIRRVGTDGIINRYVANGHDQAGFGGDGGPATSALLNDPQGVAVGPDGSLYISDGGNHRIRRVGPDGIINTVAGTGIYGHSGDGGKASVAQLYYPTSIAVGGDGSIYFLDIDYDFDWRGGYTYVRRIGPDGKISTIADPNSARFYSTNGIAVAPDGGVYVGSGPHLFRIAPNGYVITVAGCGNQWGDGTGSYCSDNATIKTPYVANSVLPKATYIYGVGGIAIAPDGSLYISESGHYKIRKVSSVPSSLLSLTDFTIATEDGKQIFVFDGFGRHVRTINALTNATLYQFGYDDYGRLTTINDGDGNVTNVQRDSSSNPSAIVAPYGQRTVLTTDPNGYIDSITNPAGELTRLAYTFDGLMTSLTDPKGNVTTFSYDDMGYLALDKNPAGGFSALSGSRTPANSQVTLTTALNKTTSYFSEFLYNGDLRLSTTNPAGATSTRLIKTNGVTQSTSPDNAVTTVSLKPDPRFDMQDPLTNITIKNPSGLTSTLAKSRTIAYSDPNNYLSLSTQTDTVTFNGQTFTTLFNASLNKFTTTTPAGRQASTITDSQGRPLSFTPDPALTPLTFLYNTRGKLVQATQGNKQSTFGYDLLGRLASRSDALGNTALYGYDNADRLTNLTLPSGRSYGFAYDANGNRTQITMPSGSVHNLGYTVINLGSDYTPPNNLPYAWQYSLDKEWTRTTLPGGRTVDAAYDTGGRPTGLVYPEATVSILYADKTDRVSRLTRTPTGGTAQQIAFTYDGSLVTGQSFSGVANGAFTYTYDNNFFLKQIGLVSGSNTITTPITRDADGLVTGYGPFTFTRTGPAGAVSQINDTALNIAITYDSLGRIASRNHTVNGQNIYSVQFTYDSTGNIAQKTENIPNSPAVLEYAYDVDGQLLKAKKNGADEEIFAYDVNGNRTSYERPGAWTVSADYDSQDSLVQQGGTHYWFNQDGQLTQRGADTFQYSAQGELLLATVNNQTITYAYDGMGRRVARTDSTGTRQYLYGDLQNQFRLTAMRDPSGTLTTFYYDEAGILFAMDKGATRYYVGADQVGTPKVVSDATGNVVDILEYDSFGMPTFVMNPDFDLPLGFAGGLADAETGLVRFGYRDYEPDAGRWMAKDPVFFKGGQGNLFAYVQNNPVNLIDPTGLDWFRPKADPYVVGRENSQLVEPGKGIGKFIDDYVPAGHTFGTLHDDLVDMGLEAGLPDALINIPTMLGMYVLAVGTELDNSIYKLLRKKPLFVCH